MRSPESTPQAKGRKPPEGAFLEVELRVEGVTRYQWWGRTIAGWMPYGGWFHIKPTK